MDKIIIYNPRNGAEINDIYAKKTWKHEVNTIKKYDPKLADYLLSKYGFLQKVLIENLSNTRKIMAAQYSCNYEGCDYITDSKQKLATHKLGKHKLTKEAKEQLEALEEAKPTGEVELSPEAKAGLPDTKKGEVDGWYGPGWEQDKVGSGMMKPKKPGVTPGHFA